MLALAVVTTMTGCNARVSTEITVVSPTETRIVAAVRFEGEVATTITNDASLETQVRSLFEARSGVTPTRSAGDDWVAYEVELTYDQLVATAGLLGVAGATVGPGPSGEATATTITLVAPDELTEAISNSVEGQVDAEALVAAMLGTTTVAVAVTFPGGIDSAEFSGSTTATVAGNTATLSQDVATFTAGTFVVAGSTTVAWWRHRLVVPVAIVIAAGGLVAWATRAPTPGASRRPLGRWRRG